ncbi:unnamed protein product [Discosporangium mesarthrocarpum]
MLTSLITKKTRHWRTVKGVLSYLNTYLSRGMTYGGLGAMCELIAYADAAYACCRKDLRSVTGGAVVYYGEAVSWMSKAQRIVALSTTGSEYIAVSTVAQEVRFLAECA